MLLAVSGLLTLMFCLETSERRDSSPSKPDNVIKTEVPPPETEAERIERRKREAIEAINAMRQAAARELRELAEKHEQEVRNALTTVLVKEIAAAHLRVPAYTDWLVTWEATWEMAKAWWNDDLESFLCKAGEERLLSAATIQARLEGETRKLAQAGAERATYIVIQYENRFTSLLAGLDEQVRVQMPPVAFPSIARADLNNPVVLGNMAGVSSFVGTALLASYGEQRFVQWLGKEATIKAGSKVVRIGSGPVGWVVSLVGGYLAEKGLDEYVIKPRLAEELHRQLDQAAAELLKDPFIEDTTHAQVLPLREMAEGVSQPVRLCDLTQQG